MTATFYIKNYDVKQQMLHNDTLLNLRQKCSEPALP